MGSSVDNLCSLVTDEEMEMAHGSSLGHSVTVANLFLRRYEVDDVDQVRWVGQTIAHLPLHETCRFSDSFCNIVVISLIPVDLNDEIESRGGSYMYF